MRRNRPRFSDPERRARREAWPDGFTFLHDPGLPDPDFAGLDIPDALKTSEVAALVRVAVGYHDGLKKAMAANPDRPGAARKATKRALARVRDQAQSLAALLSDREIGAIVAKGEVGVTEGAAGQAAIAAVKAARTDEEREAATVALASAMTTRTVEREDIPELIVRLHLLAADAERALAWRKSFTGKPPWAAERAFAWRLAEIYREKVGKVRSLHRDPHSQNGSTLKDGPFERFLVAAFDYAGVRPLPSVETLQEGVSKPPYDSGN